MNWRKGEEWGRGREGGSERGGGGMQKAPTSDVPLSVSNMWDAAMSLNHLPTHFEKLWNVSCPLYQADKEALFTFFLFITLNLGLFTMRFTFLLLKWFFFSFSEENKKRKIAWWPLRDKDFYFFFFPFKHMYDALMAFRRFSQCLLKDIYELFGQTT